MFEPRVVKSELIDKLELSIATAQAQRWLIQRLKQPTRLNRMRVRQALRKLEELHAMSIETKRY